MAIYTTYGCSYSSAFHPSQLTGGQLYLRKDQASGSSWISDIGTARDFVQGTASQQPIISTNSVDFDGVNDIQIHTENNAFIGDSSGIIFFSGYNTGNTQRVISSADNSSLTNWLGFSVFNNKIGVYVDTGSGTRFVQSSDTIGVGAYYWGAIESKSGQYNFWVNGSTSVPSVVSGSNDGAFFSSVALRNTIELGGTLRSSTLYGDAKINKIYYNNTALTPTEITNVNTFMSDPTNF